MIQAVFIDTTAWIALLDDTDTLHQPTLQVMQTLRQRQTPLVTTELVLMWGMPWPRQTFACARLRLSIGCGATRILRSL